MQDLQTMFGVPLPMLIAVTIWSTLWKGIALWRAAKYTQKYWFIAMLVLNTFGILEITYLFFFCKKRLQLQDLRLKL